LLFVFIISFRAYEYIGKLSHQQLKQVVALINFVAFIATVFIEIYKLSFLFFYIFNISPLIFLVTHAMQARTFEVIIALILVTLLTVFMSLV